MPVKTKYIFNPTANLGRAYRLSETLQELAKPASSAWQETKRPGQATEMAGAAAREGFDRVIALGGDGTVHEVLNGLMQIPVDERPTLGVVPVGSGNDFAYALGMSTEPGEAMRQVLEGTTRRIDIGAMQDGDGRVEYWSNAVGIGFDTVVTIRSRKVKLVRGFLVYLTAVLQTILLNHDPFRLSVLMDGQRWEDDLLMLVLCNGRREGGGFHVAPTSQTDDGVLDYVGVSSISRLQMIQTLPYFIKGTQSQLSHVNSGQFRRLELNSNRPLHIHTDGEIYAGFGSKTSHLAIDILPGAIQVVS